MAAVFGLSLTLIPSVAIADELDDNIKAYEEQLTSIDQSLSDLRSQNESLEELHSKAELMLNSNTEELNEYESKRDTLADLTLSLDKTNLLLRTAEEFDISNKDSLYNSNSILYDLDRHTNRLEKLNGDYIEKYMSISEKSKEIKQQISSLEEQREIVQSQYNSTLASIKEREKKKSIFDTIGGVENFNPEGIITLAQFKFDGVCDMYGFHYTYYSETRLPGGGLDIPGRHLEQNFVCDKDGYVCVASDTLEKGTIVPLPFKEKQYGKIYDCGVGNPIGLDVYIH